MKTELKQRLKSYSMAAGAVLSAGAAKSAIIYTDVNPDQALNVNGQFYNLDLNNDMTNDFRIDYFRSNFTFSTFAYSFMFVTASANGANQIAASSSFYAQALAQNTMIGNALAWNGSSTMLLAGRSRSSFSSFSFSSSYGKWLNATDKYLGLKLRVGANTYFGWARMDMNMTTRTLTIKDYAYENTNNTPIEAGKLTADPATAVSASDISDNSDGSDLQVTFNKAFDESTVSEYRVIAVKAAVAGAFDLTAAMAVTSGNYIMITPNGSNVTTSFGPSGNDADGDPIVIGQQYRIFVYSVPDGVKRTTGAISTQSNAITLNTAAEPATGLMSEDVSNNHNVSDLKVTFNRAPIEARISEYRVIVVKTADVTTFNLAAAQAVTAGRYETILPSGNNINQTLTATTQDKDGNAILESTPYVYFVLSKANGVTANVDALSQPSDEWMLSPTTGIETLNTNSAKIFASQRQLHVELSEAPVNGMLHVMDQLGRLVFTTPIKTQREQIAMNVNPGVYVVQLTTDKGKVVQRVMID